MRGDDRLNEAKLVSAGFYPAGGGQFVVELEGGGRITGWMPTVRQETDLTIGERVRFTSSYKPGVQFVKDLDPAIQAAVTDGLLAMAADPGGNQVLRLLYTVDGFQKIDATFYDDFMALLKKAGVDPASLVK